MDLKKGTSQLATAAANQEQFSGIVLIQQDDRKICEEAHGYANRSWKILNRMDTRFRVGSISKIFTAVAVLQLIEEGKLSLDASIVECLDLRGTTIPPEATVYHLLTMTSGIADWFEESGNWEEDWADLIRKHPIYLFRTNEDYLPLFIHQEPIFPVGERHQYNGAGYILLGLLIEKLSGMSYFDAIQTKIFDQAGMPGSGFVALEDVSEGVAEGYISMTDTEDQVIGWKKNIYSTTPEAAADGGATTTAVDLVRFSQALRRGELLSGEKTAAVQKPMVLSQEEKVRGYTWKYGCGLTFLLDDDENIVRWGLTGEEDGVSCRLYYYPEENLDVVILGNQSWCAGALGWEIHNLITSHPS